MDYKDTLNLPRTSFPMKASLTKKEPEIIKEWEDNSLYRRIQATREGREKFILHDGPPYANGNIHMGTAFNKVLKDIIVKSRSLAGFHAPYVPGWDCHGLPIELQVDRKLGSKKRKLTTGDFRRRCREYAGRFIDIQREEFRRLGVLGDWSDPYLTMNFPYQATIVRELGKFFEAGRVYSGFKPVHWCMSCRTALAEAEVEHEDHRSPSITVRFHIADGWERIAGELPSKPAYAVIWTTTPWTIPANLAIAVHPDFTYAVADTGGEYYIAAKDLLPALMESAGFTDYRVVRELQGKELEGLVARHPFLDRESPVVLADHVTLEAGTGMVHTAPGHGREDYEVGGRYGLEIYSPVDEGGRFVEEVEHFGGRNVFDANPEVVKVIEEKGNLLHHGEESHSYPHCWRCKKPVIFRATRQWFISMEEKELRRLSLEEIDRVEWIPSWGKERISGMIAHRPDWCISRQRSWGVPITVFVCTACEGILATPEMFSDIADRVEKEGADFWFDDDLEAILPENASCPGCGGKDFRRETDILDVWFDSGVSHAAVVEKRAGMRWPADLYLEGSDQHRGWFHSSLLTAVGTRGKAPYRGVLTHGFVVDAKGKKMAKSVGNVIAPQEIINRYGAEILRLWVAAEDYTSDIRISDEIVQRLAEAYRRMRNTARFLLGNLSDFNPAADRVSLDEMQEIDRWALARLGEVEKRVLESYERYQFHIVYHTLHNYCAVDLSAFYLDVLKDRLYVSAAGSNGRRAAQTVLHDILKSLVLLMAPMLSFTAEEIWKSIPDEEGKAESVFLETFPESREIPEGAGLLKKWERLEEIRRTVNKALEESRKSGDLGQSLEAKITVTADEDTIAFLKSFGDELGDIFIVSAVELRAVENDGRGQEESVIVGVEKAPGGKCQRCWGYFEEVRDVEGENDVCTRCSEVLVEMGRR